MLILEQNVAMISMLIAAAKYLPSGLPTASTGRPPTHLVIALTELRHGSLEFLELDIFLAYSMQFELTLLYIGGIQVLRHHVFGFFRPTHLFDDLKYCKSSKIAIL